MLSEDGSNSDCIPGIGSCSPRLHANSFSRLLQALNREHCRNLRTLNLEIARLKAVLGDESSSQYLSVTQSETTALCFDHGAESSASAGLKFGRAVRNMRQGKSGCLSKSKTKTNSSFHRSKSALDLPQLLPVWCNSKVGPAVETGKYHRVLTMVLERATTQILADQNEDRHEKESIFAINFFCLWLQDLFTFPLHPNTGFRMVWDTMALVFLLYDFYFIPMQVFDIEDIVLFEAASWILLLSWSVDIILSFSTGYLTPFGESIMDLGMVARRYFRTWFFPDLVIVSVEWCVLFLKAYMGHIAGDTASYARMSKLMRVVGVLRTLRMTRLAKMKDLVYTIQYRIDSEWMSIAWSLFCNVFTLITLNHVTACGWYFVGKTYWGTEASWVKYYGFLDSEPISKYLCALHWSLTLFTPASMDVHPVNDAERTYAVINLMLAMIVFASFVSSVTAGFTRLRNLEAQNVQKHFLLRKFLRQSSISVSLSARIFRYIAICQSNQKKKVKLYDVQLLEWLSGPLNIELRKELCSPFLMVHPFFIIYVKSSHSAVNDICLSTCSFFSVAKRDTLFGRFTMAQQMSVVTSGALVYRRATTLPCPKYTRLSEGSYFGEPAMWVNWVYHGTMKALTDCDCMAIDCPTFREVIVAHPDVLEFACRYGRDFQTRLSEVCKLYGSAWDLALEKIKPEYESTGSDEVGIAESIEAQILEWTDSELSNSEDDNAETADNGEKSGVDKIEDAVAHSLDLGRSVLVDGACSVATI